MASFEHKLDADTSEADLDACAEAVVRHLVEAGFLEGP